MKTKQTIMSVMMLGASLLFSSQFVNAQNWLLTGNPTATNASILGATTVGVNLDLYSGNALRMRLLGSNGFVGINTLTPTAQFHVTGATKLVGATTITGNATVSALTTTATFKMTGGTPGLNKIMRSDAAGLASWITNPVGANTTNRVPRWNGTQLVAGTIFDNGINVGIGVSGPNAPLQFSNGIANRKIVLFESANNDHTYYGFGVNNDVLRYQVSSTGSSHVFYAATSVATSAELMRITGSGNVGIGTNNPANKLDVCGTIRGKEVIVETGWCDYVFANDYKLPSLSEVESFIKTNKHLPDVTPGSQIESEGLEVGKTSAQMIKKIEELTLYVIELQKQVDAIKNGK